MKEILLLSTYRAMIFSTLCLLGAGAISLYCGSRRKTSNMPETLKKITKNARNTRGVSRAPLIARARDSRLNSPLSKALIYISVSAPVCQHLPTILPSMLTTNNNNKQTKNNKFKCLITTNSGQQILISKEPTKVFCGQIGFANKGWSYFEQSWNSFFATLSCSDVRGSVKLAQYSIDVQWTHKQSSTNDLTWG